MKGVITARATAQLGEDARARAITAIDLCFWTL
jgi:hypothetical protein